MATDLVEFGLGVAFSLLASWVLVSRLERLGERLGFSEALLGMVAALAADAPEITSAVSAVAHGQHEVGIGVVLGSNVFNLAALLGLGAVVAGSIDLHRRVVVLGGSVGVWIAAVTVLTVLGAITVVVGLALAAFALVLYVALLGKGVSSFGLLARWPRAERWVQIAVVEEEKELYPAIHPRRGRWSDAWSALGALVIVVVASVAMERAASAIGRHSAIPGIVTGGLVLAAVTSLPNAVAAIYLASKGKGAAALSTALNSNAINVVFGLLGPAAVVGLGPRQFSGRLVVASYLALTVFTLVLCYWGRGLRRWSGSLIIVGYFAFVVALTLNSF